MSDNRVITIDPNGVALQLVNIPSGKFLMGSRDTEVGSRDNERPIHEVHVESFYFGVFPITQRQWRSVMSKLPSTSPECIGDDLPVVNVWLEDAHDFCHTLSRRLQIPFRLPSEAEWEYACRAGTRSPYFWGDEITDQQVNFRSGSSNGLRSAGFSGVANALGLYDMHGNVWEWCSDSWHDDYRGAPVDGSSWASGGDVGYQVQRGGSWADPAAACRSAFRVGDIAHNSDDIVGLRICANEDDLRDKVA